MRTLYFILLTTLLLGGCASTGSIGNGQSASKTSAANTANVPPAPANADWQNLGVSPSGNILNEIDKLSIKREGAIVTFRDRKTIFNLRKENFLSTPKHKISINTWQMDCAQRTFRLQDMLLFDENGRQLASFSYNDKQIKAIPIVANSASYQQMLLVCQGVPGF
ncbi:hypothetical protein HZU77_001500 [Neisseriaceae bacterium TC5R-5]|nr:hypothetical protein [Neisseriaceae bacterium TC5R-5]